MARPGPGPGAHGPARRVGAMRLSEALDGMRLAYNPITKQLHFVSPPAAPQAPAPAPQAPAPPPGAAGLAKKDSFSDSGAGSVSAGEWSGGSPRAGHRRGGGSFSSTASSLSDGSLSAGYASREEEEGGEPAGAADSAADCSAKLKKKGLSGFFSRGVFPWKSSGSVSATQKNQDVSPPSALGVSWRLFSSKSSNNIANGTNGLPSESQVGATPTSSGANTPHHHKRQGSSASEKQFEDLVASSIALIQHDRPSNLPAKCEEEALRHRQEHARMVEAARRRGEREAAARRARAHEALRHEERLARHAREWTDTILNNWEHMKSSKRTYELWWCGLPPSVRGKVWQLAVGNKLNITLNLRRECVARAERKLHEAQLRRERLKQQVNPRTQLGCADLDSSCAGDTSITHDSINTLQQHGITNKTHENGLSSKNCHLHISHENESCIEVNKEENTLKRIIDDKSRRLSASQNGMHRNFSEQNLKSHRMDRPMCPSRQNSRSNPNLVECGDECSMELIQLDIARTFPHLCIFQPNGPYFDVLHELLAAYACYRPDVGYVQGMSFIGAMLILNMEAPQAFVCFANLLEEPVLKAAFTRDGATMQRLWNAYSALLQHNVPALAGRVAPELYLLEWVYTAFAKAMPLDTACRVWDLCMRDGGVFLFRTALGVLHLYQDTLKEMDFISAAQFLTKLPEELCSDALFRSISSVSMTLDGLTFQQLADCCEPPEDPGEDVVRL